MRRSRLHSSRAGQAILEGALATLVLILLITATMDLGRVLMFMQNFTERSRAGARWAVVHNFDSTAIKNYVAYNSPSAPETGVSSPGLFGLTPAHVSVTRYDAGAPADRIEVVISNFPLQFYTPFLAGAYTPRPFRTVVSVESLGASN
jgi:Flp pilus assembly protein TadG